MDIQVLDMHKFRKDLKEKEQGTPDERDLKVIEKFKKGIVIKGTHLNMIPLDFYNPMWDKNYTWWYFECPICKRKTWKIYIMDEEEIKCGRCRKKYIEYKTRNNSAAVISKIQYYIRRLYEEKATFRARSKWIRIITKFYNKLGSEYQPDSMIVFRELQTWCEGILNKKDRSPEYREAIRDVLTRLSYIRAIFIKTKMEDIPKSELESVRKKLEDD